MHIHLTVHKDKFNPIVPKDFFVAIGNFDGFHLGHQFLIKELINLTNQNNCLPLILTFNPSTKFFFNPKTNILSTLIDKISNLKNYNINHLAILDFNAIHKYSAKDFFTNILPRNFNLKGILVGDDFKFGNTLDGDVSLLKKFCFQNEIFFKSIPKFQHNNYIVSSSNIKYLLSQGNIELANQLLAKNYQITSQIILGNQLGRTIGFNTANLNIYPYCSLKYGVYITKVFLKKYNKYYTSISNFGVKPTINNNNKELLEVHIFDFNEDIYNEEISVEFLYKIRDEMKFNSLDSLKSQIHQDIIFAKQYFQTNK